MTKSYLLIVSLIVLHAHGQNFSQSGSGELDLISTNFTGLANAPAAEISNFSTVKLTNIGLDGYFVQAEQLDTSGGVGLRINRVENTIISNATRVMINGASGGTAVSTSVGSSSSASANGGVGISINDEHDPFSNFYGGPGDDQLTISSGNIKGGDGGLSTGAAGNSVAADGGVGLLVENLTLTDVGGLIDGGNGGSAQGSQGTVSANGGDAITTGLNVNIGEFRDSSSFEGGDGGTAISDELGSASTANGGLGFSFNGLNVDLMNYPQSRDVTLTNKINTGSFRGGAGGSATGQEGVEALGGNGVFATLQIMEISGGVFQGGDGGIVQAEVVTNANASGGDGFYSFQNHHLNITGGDFYGGAGGTLNGVLDDNGAGVRAIDTDVSVSGGNFYGMGLAMQSETMDTTLAVDGGSFDTISISSTEGFSSQVNITGGDLSRLQLVGASTNSIDLSGGSIFELLIESSGTNALSVGGSAALNRITQSSGYTDVNAWGDDHFMDTMVSGGVLNFNNQDFNLLDGASLVVTGSDAAVNFMGDRATVKSGASLVVSSGSVEANELQVESGGSVMQTITSDGADSFAVSEIMSDSLTVDAGALWQLYNVGSFTDFNSVLGTDGFLLGASSASNFSRGF